MKIAILSERYPPDVGGLAVSAHRLATLLQQAGRSVEVFAPQSSLKSGDAYSVQEGSLVVNRFGAHRHVEDTLAAWFDQLLDKHKSGPFDILHGFYLVQAGFIAAYAGQYLNLPAVVSARGNDLDRSVLHPSKAAHILYALQYASVITANSSDLKRKAQALAPRQRVEYIPNSVDGDLFQPGPRPPGLAQALGLSGAPVIGFAGEARAKKGLATILLAFEKINACRRVDLLLVGEARAGQDEELVQVFRKQNPALHLYTIPNLPLEQMPDLYRLMDIFWMPSLRDGMPNALLEAMACALPVIATPVGGIRDIIEHAETGWFAPAGDFAALAEATQTLLDNLLQRQAMGQAARRHVLQEHAPKAELQANLSLYQRLLVTKPSGDF